MEDRFEIFMKVIMQHEGGYVNDPDDRGGETKYGITKSRYPDLDIKNLTIQGATALYLKDFFKPMNLYYVRSDLLALHLFDMGINSSPKRAIRLLQELLNGCINDGVIGPVTAQALSNASITTNMIKAYMAKRIEWYYKVSTRWNNGKFLKGWINRVYSTKLP